MLVPLLSREWSTGHRFYGATTTVKILYFSGQKSEMEIFPHQIIIRTWLTDEERKTSMIRG